MTASVATGVPSWLVCRGQLLPVAAGLVECPSQGLLDVAACGCCRFLEACDSDRTGELDCLISPGEGGEPLPGGTSVARW